MFKQKIIKLKLNKKNFEKKKLKILQKKIVNLNND